LTEFVLLTQTSIDIADEKLITNIAQCQDVTLLVNNVALGLMQD